MFHKRWMLLIAMLTVAFAMMAQTPDAIITFAVTGTLGPILQGSDPLGANGHTGTLTVKISESATPVVSNATFAAYVVPAGAVVAVIGSMPYTTTTPSKLNISLGTSADTLSVIYNSQSSTNTRFIAALAPGSLTTAALMHPTPFSPSPQSLTSATSAAGPGSQLWYTDAGMLTVLGLTGSISNSARVALLPAFDPEF